MLKVALIVPPGYSVAHAQFNLERMGLQCLVGPLRRDGQEVIIIDGVLESLGWDEILQRIKAVNPDLVGISVMSHDQFPRLATFISHVRKKYPSAHICLGGVFPSLNAYQLLRAIPEVDSIACGEGERTLPELCRALLMGESVAEVPGLAQRRPDGQLMLNPVAPSPHLDESSITARDQLPLVLSRGGPASLISSRGCYGKCCFCALHALNRSLKTKNQRLRSPRPVVDEMEALNKTHGVQKFYFLDENFVGAGRKGRERAEAIAMEILRRRMNICFSIECRCNDVSEKTFRILAEAGLQRVFLGVESTEEDELNRLRKGQTRADIDRAIAILRSLDIHIEIGFILFLPWSTLDSLERKRLFIEQFGSGATGSLGSYLSVAPGTVMVDRLRKDGLLRGEWPRYAFHFLDGKASILFGILQRQILPPWDQPLQRLLGFQWSQPLDWSLEHAYLRTKDPGLSFLQELLEWTAAARLRLFDQTMNIVSDLNLPRDAESAPAEIIEKLTKISDSSIIQAEELAAMLNALQNILSAQPSYARGGYK